MVCEADTDGGAADKRSFIEALISICLFARGVLGVLLPALALRRRDALIAIIELRLCGAPAVHMRMREVSGSSEAELEPVGRRRHRVFR